MRSDAKRAGLLIVLAAVAVGLFIVLSGGDDSDSDDDTTTETSTTATTTGPDDDGGPAAPLTIVIKGGQPVGGVQSIEASKGDQVRFVVRSDVADEVHLHGYDISKEVAAGGEVSYDFPATIEGVFEVELEESATPIAELTVQP